MRTPSTDSRLQLIDIMIMSQNEDEASNLFGGISIMSKTITKRMPAYGCACDVDTSHSPTMSLAVRMVRSMAGSMAVSAQKNALPGGMFGRMRATSSSKLAMKMT